MLPVLNGLRITSPFGYRTHPVHGDVRLHTGVDLACANNDPILSAQSGNVIFASGTGWSQIAYDIYKYLLNKQASKAIMTPFDVLII